MSKRSPANSAQQIPRVVRMYFPHGKVIHDPPPEKWQTKLWDARPLESGSWGNILGCDDGSGSRGFIDMRWWIPPFTLETPEANPPPYYMPARIALPPGYRHGGVRRCYRPTKEDLEIVACVYPGHPPQDPPWPRVEADLTVAGRSPSELASMIAPALLRLAVKAAGDGEDKQWMKAQRGERASDRQRDRKVPKQIEMKGKAGKLVELLEKEEQTSSGRSLDDMLREVGVNHDTFRSSQHFKDARATWERLREARRTNRDWRRSI